MHTAAPAAGPSQSHGHAPPPRSRWQRPPPGQATKPHRHRPVTDTEEEHVYVLTLRLTPSLHDPLNELRTHYFPPHRLKVAAHLTLFHALPHSKLASIVDDTAAVAAETAPFRVTTGRAFLLGKNGVAIAPGEGTEEGAAVHARLREKWEGFLSKQDAKAFKAHWTCQNKVDDEEKVLQAFEELKRWAKEKGAEGEATGLVLWKYVWGKWEFEKEFGFEGKR
ncbi:hypothetical protein JCM10207_007987 [Rhodosporidiobolus poonsookiae]